MDKETALKVFYETNEIDPIHVADPLDECYDKRLAELPRRVDQWLLGVEPEDREIFLNLLSKYCYLRRPQCQLRYGQILSLLRDRLSELQLDLSNVLVVTVEAGGPCASGGDNVRSDLRYRNLETLSKNQIIAVQAKLKEEDLATYRAVLFLDDVIGSGVTMWSSIQQLYKRFPVWLGRQKIFCAGIAPRKKGIDHVTKNCKNAQIPIEWLYDPTWVQDPAFCFGSPEYKKLERYEKIIGEYMTEPGKSCFMGFNKNRLLLSFYYNTPNNTLSTFWRIGVEMEPPFYRDGNQVGRPHLDDLRKRKAQLSKQAYLFGIDRKNNKGNDD